MPITVTDDEDYCFLYDNNVAAIYLGNVTQKPLEIAVFNLTPADRQAELRVIKMLSYFPLPINVTVFDPSCSAATAAGKPKVMRLPFNEAERLYFNGLVATGEPNAPAFNRFEYRNEFADILDWTNSNVTSAMFTGWSAQAALHRFYGVKKSNLKDTCRGIFENIRIPDAVHEPLMNGIADRFEMPHCHRSIVYAKDVLSVAELKILAYSKRAGATVIKSADGRRVFVTGHMDYGRYTLKQLYRIALEKDPETKPPANYFAAGTDGDVKMNWTPSCTLFYINWLNYCVYNAGEYSVEKLMAAAKK